MDEEHRWTKIALWGAAVMTGAWVLILTPGPSVAMKSWAIATTIIAYMIVVVTYLHGTWSRDYRRRFDDQLLAFYRGVNGAYARWRQLRIMRHSHENLPAEYPTVQTLAEKAGWVLAIRYRASACGLGPNGAS